MKQEELNKILARHKLWLETNGKEGERADLAEADLARANLTRADLARANLARASLTEANLARASLTEASLEGANLKGANLVRADLARADLDFSAFPLWCGGLDVHIDDRQAIQLLYHLVRNVQFSKNTGEELKKLLGTKEIINKANEFHRVDECDKIPVPEFAVKGKELTENDR